LFNFDYVSQIITNATNKRANKAKKVVVIFIAPFEGVTGDVPEVVKVPELTLEVYPLTKSKSVAP